MKAPPMVPVSCRPGSTETIRPPLARNRAENLRHLSKGLAERGGAFGMRRAGLGPTGGGMIFGLWA